MAHEVTRHRISCDDYKSPPSPGGFPFPPSSYGGGFPFPPSSYDDGFPFPPSSYCDGFPFAPSSYGGFPFPPSSPGSPSSYGPPFAPTYNGFPFPPSSPRRVPSPPSSYGSLYREYPVDHSFAGGFPSQTDQQITDQSHEISLDINEIATSLRDQFITNKVFSSTCCIYRVPARLRRLNEEAYTPRVVSIGPLHHRKENLKAMEDHKLMYLQQFLKRSKVRVEDLIKVVRDNETALRDCYAETSNLCRKDFATMILLDAAFVIMVLLKSVGESNESLHGDQIFHRPFKFVDVVFDMCLLENQLPFFILEKLFELSSVAADPKNCTVIELTSQLLHQIMAQWVKEDSWKTINSSEVLHFVDFIRKCQRPTERSSEERKTTISIAPSATKLHQSGVKFKHPGRNSLFDVSFNEGTLEIPQLKIDDRTETLFRNLQAFEQCHYLCEDSFVSDYLFSSAASSVLLMMWMCLPVMRI